MIERFFPNQYEDKISNIDIEKLMRKGIKGLLIDIDNTLIDYYENIEKDTKKWINSAKGKGLQMYLLSNNNKKRVDKIGKMVGLNGIHYAAKPRRKGILIAMKKMELNNNEIAIIGDQIFTDVYGGNRLNIYTILVKQINKKDIWITKWKRPIEENIIKKYLKNDLQMIKSRDAWKLKSAIRKKVQ